MTDGPSEDRVAVEHGADSPTVGETADQVYRVAMDDDEHATVGETADQVYRVAMDDDEHATVGETADQVYRVAVSSDENGPVSGFDHLWTPYRMAYIRGEGKPTGEHDCPFCLIPRMSDEDGLIVARGEHVFAVLNLYPYNAGHLMLVPYRHVPDYTDLTPAEVAELGAFTQTAMRVIRSVTGAHGFNIGMNQGSVAGAGIADHLHQHAVPRWGGDTNFMPVIGLTRVLPQVLSETRALLAAAWAERASGRAVPSDSRLSREG